MSRAKQPRHPLRLPPLVTSGAEQQSHSINPQARDHKKEENARASSEPDVISFDEIFRDQLSFIWRCLAGFGVRDADLQDQTQEVLVIVHRRLQDFDGRSLRGWLYGICQRLAAAYRRKASVRRERLASSPHLRSGHEASGPEDVDARRLELELMKILNELDDDKRTVFVLYEVEELTLQEIAEAVGCPLQTAYSRLRAARKHVVNAFSPYDERSDDHG